jgi:hypothetical protein
VAAVRRRPRPAGRPQLQPRGPGIPRSISPGPSDPRPRARIKTPRVRGGTVGRRPRPSPCVRSSRPFDEMRHMLADHHHVPADRDCLEPIV